MGSFISKAQNDSLRLYDKDLNGYVLNEYKIAKRLADSVQYSTATYDRSVNGDIATGADTALTLDNPIPVGARITNVFADVETTMGASGGTGTLDIKFGSTAVVSAATEASLAQGFPTLTKVAAACRVTTEATAINLRAATAAFETGKMRVIFEFIMAR